MISNQVISTPKKFLKVKNLHHMGMTQHYESFMGIANTNHSFLKPTEPK